MQRGGRAAARAAYQIACAHDRRGEEAAAIPFYQQALAGGLGGEERAGALIGLGSSLRNVGRIAEAEELLAGALRERPGDAAAAAFLALARHGRGDGHGAVAELLALAAAHAPVGRYDRALRFYAAEVARGEAQQGGLPVEESARFLARVMPHRPCRVLDVGCGDGRLAAALASRGHQVTGLDGSAAAAEQARGRGIRADRADFLRWSSDERFDVVLFSRSLHHMHDLGAAVARAAGLLAPRGIVVGEELAVERMDAATASAHYALRGEPGSLARWRRDHARHGVASSVQMRRALARHLTLRREERAPYLYRYLCDAVPAEGAGRRLAEHWLAVEQAQIAAGAWRAVGWRFVARKSRASR